MAHAYVKPGWTQTYEQGPHGTDIVHAPQDKVFRAALRQQAPLWVCDHQHPTSGEAYECAIEMLQHVGHFELTVLGR